MKGLKWKIALVSVVLLAVILFILPSINPNLWPHRKISLGLDLQGGMHLVLAVDTNKAIENNLEQICIGIRSIMRESTIDRFRTEITNGMKINVILKNESQAERLKSLIYDNYSNLRIIDYTNTTNGLFKIIFELNSDRAEEIKKLAVSQALETIRNRIDQFGVNEPDIRLHGEQNILIQLPGIKDTQRAKELIGQTAMLEFKIVDETNLNSEKLLNGIMIPTGSVVMYKRTFNTTKGSYHKSPILLKKHSPITGAHLIDARVSIDSKNNTPYVTIKFNKIGAKIFEQITSENLNKRLAIVLDGSVHSTPVITTVIPRGEAQITGGFTMETAKDLAIVLRAGALPAPVEIIEERTVGASLGIDSIKTGMISIFVGSIIVVLFMIFYYKMAGLIADFALIFNVLIIAAGLAAFQATLTLPGIAGIILTIGMAVDANVLIFERIREERRLGRSPISSVITGYERATLTILDANITTLIAAIVLFQFGTGPVKGFAITLSLGVLASLFTSLILTKTIFELILKYGKNKKISI